MKQFEEQGNLHNLIGMDAVEAHAYLKRFGKKLRVVQRNGQPLITTRDYVQNRVNVSIKDDLVDQVLGLG